eukprot:2675281-Rhodomonas_salina.2
MSLTVLPCQHCYDFHPEYTCVLVNGALRTVLAKQKTITSSISINRMCVSSTTKPPLGPVFLVLVVGMSSGPSNCSSRPWAKISQEVLAHQNVSALPRRL